jgi:Tfp pilus assembly ATPase PilU
MTIRIWYTTSVKPLGNKVAAEVVRHWQHPLTRGSVAIWAGFFADANKAQYEAQQEAAFAAMEQQRRDAECVNV